MLEKMQLKKAQIEPAQLSSEPVRSNRKPIDMTGAINILEGDTFFVSDPKGDIPQHGAYGLYRRDTRFLSKFLLRLDGCSLDLISSGQHDYFSAGFFLCNFKGDKADERTMSVIRKRLIDGGLHEELIVENHNDFDLRVEISFDFEADFADLFEVKSQMMSPARAIERSISADQRRIVLSYRRGDFFRAVDLIFSKAASISANRAVFVVDLPAKGRWDLLVRMDLLTEVQPTQSDTAPAKFDLSENETSKALQKWEENIPVLQTDNDKLNHCYKRSCIDLAALRIHCKGASMDEPLLAAGLPWYMTLFGRDTLIASYQAIILGTGLGERAVQALAKLQGTTVNDYKDEQPGKILHELRHGELTQFGDEPHSPYYGSVDSTMLFIIVINEVYRWSGNKEFLKQMRPAIANAIGWIEKYGGLDQKGYVYYETRSSKGLRNQSWKDSADAIQFFDGRLADPPIALCEVQGYTYDAYLRAAEIFQVLGESELAGALAMRAANLADRFNKDFWLADHNRYALGIDAHGQQIDAVCSNMGHLLWSGIVDRVRAPLVAVQLMDPTIYSGWGVRTLATNCRGFNPLGYHIGAVWPHDNAIIAAGLRRYGFAEEAAEIIEGMLCAAAAFEHRLPEAFAGYRRGRLSFPARYPTGCSPQAWASGAPLLFLRTMLGLEPDVANGQLLASPHLPKSVGNLTVTGIPVGDKRFSVKVESGQCEVSVIK